MKKFSSMRGAKDDDFLARVNGNEKQEGLTFSQDGVPLAYRKVTTFQTDEHKMFNFKVGGQKVTSI
jgi:hypothetical protein